MAIRSSYVPFEETTSARWPQQECWCGSKVHAPRERRGWQPRVRVLRRKCHLFSMTIGLQRHGFPPLISPLARAYCGEKRIRRSTLFSRCIVSVGARTPKPCMNLALQAQRSWHAARARPYPNLYPLRAGPSRYYQRSNGSVTPGGEASSWAVMSNGNQQGTRGVRQHLQQTHQAISVTFSRSASLLVSIQLAGGRSMATWVRCTTPDGSEVRVNADHVAIVRPYKRDRGGSGTEIIFAGGAPSTIIIQEDQAHLTGKLALSP